jgi:hypothetical protein
MGRNIKYLYYYIKKKLFACVYENGVGVKIPENKAYELFGKKGIIHFQPLGRAKMREWIQINREKSEDYLKDQEIFDISIKFVYIGKIKKLEYCGGFTPNRIINFCCNKNFLGLKLKKI